MRISNIIKFFILLFIAIFIFKIINYVSYPDEISYTNTLNFKEKEKNSIDYIFLGSSHVYKGVIPDVLDYNLDVNSYNYATSNQVIEYNYFQIKEILKTQQPDYIFLDLFNLIDRTDDDVALHKAIDTSSISFDKYKVATDNIEETTLGKMLFPIIEYHLQWKDDNFLLKISNRLKNKNNDNYKGYQLAIETLGDNSPIEPIEVTDEKLYLPEERQAILDDIVQLCEDEDVELVFYVSPFINSLLFTIDDLEMYKNGLMELYSDHKFIDMNLYYDEIGLTKYDFFDIGHLNIHGAYKTTSYLSQLIENDVYFKIHSASDEEIEKNKEIFSLFLDEYNGLSDSMSVE